MKSIYLFRFTSYSYCQGTRDRFSGDMRLLHFSMPCNLFEAKMHLTSRLKDEGIEYEAMSIKDISFQITNS